MVNWFLTHATGKWTSYRSDYGDPYTSGTGWGSPWSMMGSGYSQMTRFAPNLRVVWAGYGTEE